MSVFAYNPEAAKSWANGIVNYLNGGSESISACSKKLSEQIEILVQPNVWTGSAAAQNYQNFMDTHRAFIKFINSFGDAFRDSMTKVNKAVAELEMANLGADTNIESTFGTLSYDQIAALSEQNINKAEVTYDYDKISEVSSSLKSIVAMVDSIKTNLTNKINELNNGSGMWDGTSAEQAKETLSSIISSNMQKINELLTIDVKEISDAAARASQVDRGA